MADLSKISVSGEIYYFKDEEAREILKEKIGQEELAEAVDNALAEAKESGEFDGEDGADGGHYTPSVADNGNGTMTVSFSASKSGMPTINPVTITLPVPEDGEDGENGGYYTPSVNTVTENTFKISFAASKSGMPAVGDVTITLPTAKDGEDGQDGTDGVGIESVVQTTTSTADGGENVVTVTLTNGNNSTFTVKNGSKGNTGEAGADGTDGKDGVSVTHSWSGTTLTITSASGTTSANLKGDKGNTGETGANGKDGTNGVDGVGIKSITKTSTSGLVDTYTITLSNNTTTTFTVTNGKAGTNGINGTNGTNGTSVTVSSVTESAESGGSNVVNFSDGKTVTIKNGKDGKSAYQYAKDGGFTGTEAEFAAKLAKDYDTVLEEKADKNAFYLGIAEDGLIHIFVDGVPVGAGVPQGQGGDAYGYVDAENLIVLKGNLQEGATYTFAYVMPNGKEITIGTATLDSNREYYVKNTLTKCSNTNPAVAITEGANYSATLTPNSGYGLSTVKVTMEDVNGNKNDITSTVYNSSTGKITITSVTGNIEITATATVNNYTITKNLSNCSIKNNTATGVNHGASYNATIEANSGYELKSVTVTMGGNPVSVSGGTISIASVDGHIVITAVAEATGPKNLSVPSEWVVDRRLSVSSGLPKDDVLSGRMITNFVSAKLDQTLEVEGLDITKSSQGQDAKIVWYNSGKTVIGGLYGSTANNGDSYALSVTTNGNVQSVKLLYDNLEHKQKMTSAAEYIRIEGVLRSGYTKEDVVITVK